MNLTLIKMQVRYNKTVTVVDFILGLHDVYKVPRVYC